METTRRHFLKKAGVAIAFPFMSSIPAIAAGTRWAQPNSNKRMVFVSTGLGMYPGAFFPRNFGIDFAPSPVLESMMKHKGLFTVFSNMDHPNIYAGHGGLKSFLNGTGKGIGNLPTVDQIAANAVGYETRFPSLHMSTGGKRLSVD